MIDSLTKEPDSNTTVFPISKREYLQWAAGFIFDGLRNQRYGQSFCNRFEILPLCERDESECILGAVLKARYEDASY